MTGEQCFGRVVSAVYAELASEGALLDDVRAFGAPGECGHDVARGMEGRIDAILAASGMTRDSFNAELAARVSDKFIWQHCLFLDPEWRLNYAMAARGW